MIVLQKSDSDQTFSFIPRSYTQGNTYTVKLTNETTNKQAYSDTTTSFTATKYYYQYTDTFTLVEDTMYNLEITQGSTVVYKDKVFCTNQAISSYSVNNNQYTTHSEDNEFIVL